MPAFEVLIATPIQFVIGARFYRGAFNALRGGSANMDVLVVLGTTAAYGFSWYLLQTLGEEADGQLYFEASASSSRWCYSANTWRTGRNAVRHGRFAR